MDALDTDPDLNTLIDLAWDKAWGDCPIYDELRYKYTVKTIKEVESPVRRITFKPTDTISIIESSPNGLHPIFRETYTRQVKCGDNCKLC